MVVEVVAASTGDTGPPSGTPRRAVLRGAGALAGLAAAGSLVAGCARPEGPDPLEGPLAAARDDAVTAAAAAAAYPELAGRLTPLADARRAHADALAAENPPGPPRPDRDRRRRRRRHPVTGAAVRERGRRGDRAPELTGHRSRRGRCARPDHRALPLRSADLRGGELRGPCDGARVTQPLDDDGLQDAVLAALGTEHAAIWVYGLVSAFLPPSTTAAVAAASLAHRERRDAVVALLGREGVAAPPGAAAYRPPSPVTDAASAAALAAVAEDDVAAAWRAVAERTDAPTHGELRRIALEAVTAAATVSVTWRGLAGRTPLVATFPGDGTES